MALTAARNLLSLPGSPLPVVVVPAARAPAALSIAAAKIARNLDIRVLPSLGRMETVRRRCLFRLRGQAAPAFAAEPALQDQLRHHRNRGARQRIAEIM